VPAFFNENFPGVTDLIPPETLIRDFSANPHLPLISIKCSPYHFSSSAVIVGDAAHAMVPFYGQGMNAGLEDVRILFGMLDRHIPASQNATSAAKAEALKLALEEYSKVRVPDAQAMNDMALQNYVEMRASVISPVYRLRKYVEETLSVYFPGLGWQTRYEGVSFGTDRYSEVLARSERQGRVLSRVAGGIVGLPLIAGACFMWFKYRRSLHSTSGNLFEWVQRAFGVA
jgi:kynurenine 3-monooxygenase